MTSIQPTPESLLHQIAQIQRLDRGFLSIIRQGPNGPYYNHQCYEGGRKVTRYVAAEELPALQEAIQAYRRFQELVDQYVALVVERTRAERKAGFKKKTPPQNCSWPKIRKSSR